MRLCRTVGVAFHYYRLILKLLDEQSARVNFFLEGHVVLWAEICCSSKCRDNRDCVGYPCSKDSDCGNGEYCCNGKCSEKCTSAATIGIIVGAVVGSLVFVCMIVVVACRLRQRSRATITTITTASAIQRNAPHPGQVPMPGSYQQGSPHYPPLQNEQQQHMTNPPPHYPEITTASEQPPPYNAAPQGVSGGVYAPKPSYGAIPLAPPV
ncbi:hypothetical protein ACROYT_G018115 [Oculina patagonica]